MKFRILKPDDVGPSFFEFPSLDEMCAVLMAMAMYDGTHRKAWSAWVQKRGRWAPMWPWQLLKEVR